MSESTDAIIACATGSQTHCAISVIRLSGFEDISLVSKFFSLKKFTPYRMSRTNLLDENQPIDDICVCFYPAPKSFTGENVLELFIHGNPLNIERTVNLFLQQAGFRLALPGEFSRRALKNKKMTLTQAEGLDLFLNASTPLALSQGLSLMNGELHQMYLELFHLFKSHRVCLELLLDFHEDVGEAEARSQLFSTWDHFFKKISQLATRLNSQSSKLLRPSVVIAGLPNSGKSTLFNQILQEDRAIVTSQAGTTRDYLSESFSFKGVTYRLVDTAGIRDAEDVIEREGIALGLKQLSHAFFRCLLINPVETDSNSLKSLLQQDFDGFYLTHADHPDFLPALHKLELELGVVLSGHPQLNLLSLTDLIILDDLNKKYLELSHRAPILHDRHVHIISTAYEKSAMYNQILRTEGDLAILSHELNSLGHCLEDLLGIVSPDEVLDHLFANFCIGK
jgi:tRNA modification GTPase